jgi:hypothetical protein
MYRDVAHELDEHDSAVGSILIGEALVAGCENAERRLRDPKLADPWTATGDAQFFAEIWRHLDRAKRLLAQRGINTAGYDKVRPLAKGSVIAQGPDGRPRIDLAAIDDARRAIEELKLVVPGADWIAIEKRTAGLAKQPIAGKHKNRVFLGTIGAMLLLAVAAYGGAIQPGKKVAAAAPGFTMHEELVDIAIHRKERIAELSAITSTACYPVAAHELIESLAMDGRNVEAKQFGEGYLSRCGGDPIIEKWANAPRPWHSSRKK